jgi:hypothetical protein
MKPSLPRPTVKLVRAEGDKFDQEPLTRLGEEALGQLLSKFPRNTEVSHVLLKVLVLNKLSSAWVRDVDVKPLARHIAGLGIDPLLAEGSPATVDLITHCENLKLHFSFASKYCSWHNPDAYPIYDTYVEACLWYHRKQDGFAKYAREGYRYPDFVRIVTAFREFYGLTSFTFKQLDKFLWSQGRQLLVGM